MLGFPQRFSGLQSALCEFSCVMTWLLPLISDMRRGICGNGAGQILAWGFAESVNIRKSEHLLFTDLALLWILLPQPGGEATPEPQLQHECFPEAHLTHFHMSLFNHCMKIIQHVSVSIFLCKWRVLPFFLCAVQRCISLGYPPQETNNTTSWRKVGDVFFSPCPALWSSHVTLVKLPFHS